MSAFSLFLRNSADFYKILQKGINMEIKKEKWKLSDIQYGPFLGYLKDTTVTDIDYNGKALWIKDINSRRWKVEDDNIKKQLTPEFIRGFAQNVGNLVGKNLNPIDNVIEAETEDLRITILHDSIAVSGLCICIRKTPPVQRITPAVAIEEGYCEEEVLHLLANCVKAKLNMVFCGEPGVGKTECAKFLTAFIPAEEKVITIEDTREIHYREINPGKDCLEWKVNEHFNYEDALKEVLRMNPNRVMLSEVRSTEVQQLVECWTSGITGFTTLHTDDVRKIPDRILNMMPSREDAERLTNDVYVGMDVGILLDTRFNQEKGENRRYINQIAFFSREEEENRCRMLVVNGRLKEKTKDILPEDVKNRMKKMRIEDPFYCLELKQRIDREQEGV